MSKPRSTDFRKTLLNKLRRIKKHLKMHKQDQQALAARSRFERLCQ